MGVAKSIFVYNKKMNNAKKNQFYFSEIRK